MKKLSVFTRILTLCAALLLITANYLPIWRIELAAPQYPEGLFLNIWTSKLGGNVDIINGLNHYIGMKTLHADEFIEFTVLPYIIWGFVGLGIITAVLNKRRFFYIYFSLIVLFAVTAMADFYRWEYNYGHNLNPEAPIQVPGMAYQPPLIGYKKLLNFGAYSIPDKGGWMIISSGVLLLIGVAIEGVKKRKEKKIVKMSPVTFAPAAMVMIALSMLGCTSGPENIRFGKDGCDHCKMTIMDKKFGGEIVTAKGKIFRFDDIQCVLGFINSKSVEKNNIGGIYFLDYTGTGTLLKSDAAFLLSADALHSPMGGNIAAFPDEASRQKVMNELHGSIVNWNDLMK